MAATSPVTTDFVIHFLPFAMKPGGLMSFSITAFCEACPDGTICGFRSADDEVNAHGVRRVNEDPFVAEAARNEAVPPADTAGPLEAARAQHQRGHRRV